VEPIMVSSVGGSSSTTSVSNLLKDQQVKVDNQRIKANQEQARLDQIREDQRAEQNRENDARRGQSVNVTV